MEKILNKIIKTIKEEKQYLEKANEIDNKHYKLKIDIKELEKITEQLKKQNLILKNIKEKNIIISHNGNPYVTYIIAAKAIANNINIKICMNETMLGVNSVLIKIINEALKEINIKLKLEIIRNLNTSNLQGEKIIILQDKFQYTKLIQENYKNVLYKPCYNILLYANEKEINSLKMDIYSYCQENFIEIEIYSANNVCEAIEQMEKDCEGETILLLTKEKIEKQTNLKLNVNENVLKNMNENLIKSDFFKV